MIALRDVALLSLVTAWLAFTLSETELFAPVRTWVGGRNRWLGEQVARYCTGFRDGLALTAICHCALFGCESSLPGEEAPAGVVELLLPHEAASARAGGCGGLDDPLSAEGR